MNNLNNAVNKLKEIANEVLAAISNIDEKINGLIIQRDKLTSGKVSKADYLDYMGVCFKNKATLFEYHLLKGLNVEDSSSFGYLERNFKNKEDFIGVRFLVPFAQVDAVSEGAMYYYLADVMLARIAKSIDAMQWDDNAMPVIERRAALVAIEADIKALKEQRAEIVKQIDGAGFVR